MQNPSRRTYFTAPTLAALAEFWPSELDEGTPVWVADQHTFYCLVTTPPLPTVSSPDVIASLHQNSVWQRYQTTAAPGSRLFYNVIDYGASPVLSRDNGPAIQSAIDAAYANGGGIVFFPAGTYGLQTTVSLKQGVQILGADPSLEDLSILQWTGAPIHGPMLLVRNMQRPMVSFLSFNANGLADQCLQILHVPGDTYTPQAGAFFGCGFGSAVIDNVLIGQSNLSVASTGDCSNNTFYSCRYNVGVASAHTVNHFHQRAKETFQTLHVGCWFEGTDDGTGSGYPTYAFHVESGSANSVGCVFTTLGSWPIVFDSDALGTMLAGGGFIEGAEIQSTLGALVDQSNSIAGGIASQIPISFRDFHHSDIFTSGKTNSIDIKASGFGATHIENATVDYNVNVQLPASGNNVVYIHGLTFTNASRAVTGNLAFVAGEWYENNAIVMRMPNGLVSQYGAAAVSSVNQAGTGNARLLELANDPISSVVNTVVIGQSTTIDHYVLQSVNGFVSIGKGSAGISLTGSIRLYNTGSVYARNAANSNDVRLISIDASDNVAIASDIANNVFMNSASYQLFTVNLAAKFYHTVNGATVSGQFNESKGTGTGATPTFNFNNGNTQTIVQGANITSMTLSNPIANTNYTFIFTQDSSGPYTISFPASFKLAGGSFVPSAGSKSYALNVFYDGTNYIETSRAMAIG